MTFEATDLPEKSAASRGRQSVLLKFNSDELNTLKIPIEECLSLTTGSNTRNDSIEPSKEDELELKHRILNTINRRSIKYVSASPTNSSFKDNSDSDDDHFDFDDNDDVGDETTNAAMPFIPVSANLELEKRNRANKEGM